MDDLVHHCLRELSFDGDLGCNISRLKDFIVDFYAQPGAPHVQNPDDAFCAFVWSLVVEQPTVRVGTVPETMTSDVWIAPQTSKRKKAKEKGEDFVEEKPPQLDIVSDAKNRSLGSLIDEFGDKLRIAVEPNAIYAAITGSHIRFAKLSPMVYSALQIITRGRDNGVSLVALGQQSGYDQKTCFYLTQQLQSLNLVVKVRRPGVGSHSAIHRYFFDKSPHWKAIREEENEAEEVEKTTRQHKEDTLEEETTGEGSAFGFTPIDARHLSSLPLVKARVVKLLKASKNYIHESNNMLITIGFANPTKTDRRFFQSRIRELIQQGVIEKVVVPSSKKKATTASVKCFRLVTSENKPEGVTLDIGADDERAEVADVISGVKMNVTIHKQILDLLEESGTRGMTLHELSVALSQFDKRTIELLLARADKVPPPPHLSDLGIAGLMETSGRERRHRYYTIAAYRQLIAQEQLDQSSAGYADADFTTVGEFANIDPNAFYDDEDALTVYQDTYKTNTTAMSGRKKKVPKNPILPDGTVKQGRPRKNPPREVNVEGNDRTARRNEKRKPGAEDLDLDAIGPGTKKRRANEDNGGNADIQASKPRGRPSKNKSAPAGTTSVVSATIDHEMTNEAESIPLATPKKRGRPPKKRPAEDEIANIPGQRSKRKRGLRSEDVIPQPASVPCSPASIVAEDLRTEEVTAGPSVVTKPAGLNRSVAPYTGDNRTNRPDNTTSPTQSTSIQSITASVDTPSRPSRARTVPIDPTLIQETPRELTTILNPSPFGSKKTASGHDKPMNPKSRVNVSHLRRESELYKVIENFGGIVNVQTREFFDAHTALLETLAKAGEQTSAPLGTKTDKRTAAAALDALEGRGKIKQLKTSIQTHTGVNRPARIAYLSHVAEAQLQDFLGELSRSLQPAPQTASFVKIDERVEYGADPTSISRGSLPLQLLQTEQPGTDKQERWSKNITRANQLFTYDDETIREVLLAERTTLGQLYGFIVGKIARVRELCLLTLRAFESNEVSSNLVSKEHKIVEISFFCHDLPLVKYSSFVSCLSHSDELSAFFSTEQGRQTLVRDLPPQLHSLLQIGRSRARSRFLDMLEVLRLLHIATPLRASESDSPWIICEANGNHPTKFDQASLDGWTTSTPMVAPSYWQFNNVAPIHAWRESETNPPFWEDMQIDTADSALLFWEALHAASVGALIHPNGGPSSTQKPASTNVSLARSLRRSGSWNPQYVLTWHQMQYLRQFVDIQSAETPLEVTNENTRNSILERVCRVTSASRAAVAAFYRETRDKLLRELDKQRQKEKRPGVEKRAQRAAEVRGLLARKAAEARRKREQEWDALLLRVHPTPLGSGVSARVKRVQKRFLEAGSTQEIEKWESEIAGAIRDADLAQMLKVSSKRQADLSAATPLPPPPPPPTVLNPVEPSVQSLIVKQGAPLPPKEPHKKKRRSKNTPQDMETNETPNKVSRRHRFQWNRDYDELARDAAAIIRARCRNVARVDWAAFEQVFPAVPRNTVRQRLAHIREAPGNEAYMNRLEEKWHELWTQHRGTPLLPDGDPQSTSNFDLAKHIEFLRKHIDKNALRVGYGHARESGTIIIPPTIEELLAEYQIDTTENLGLTWDFMWNANVEEGREKRLMRQAFVKGVEAVPSSTEPPSEPVALAEAALKMVLGTPNELYDAGQGALILQSVGQTNVEVAAKAMIGRGVLSKLIRDPQKLRPGRHLKISDMNLNTIGGSIPKDTFQDAMALEEAVAQDDAWHEWPLTATDGECAALVELVIENKFDFRIDTSRAQAARLTLDWNSKKADDDQIEVAIFYHRNVPSGQVHDVDAVGDQDEAIMVSDEEVLSNHGVTEHGELASCRLTARDSLVDCASCLRNTTALLEQRSRPERRELLHRISQVIQNIGKDGITMSALEEAINIPQGDLWDAVRQLSTSPCPLVYWTGYTSSMLVSALFIKHWSVKVCESPIQRVFPRRWLNTEGGKIGEFWEAALKAVLGLVIFRPGISQAEIRWRLRSTYDRQEVHGIMRHLFNEGFLCVKVDTGQEGSQDALVSPDDHDGRGAFYFIGYRRWYQS